MTNANNSLTNLIHAYLDNIGQKLGFDTSALPYIKLFFLVIAISLISFIAYEIFYNIFKKILRKLANKTTSNIDDLLLINDFPKYLSRIIPLIIVLKSVPLISNDFISFSSSIELILNIYGIFIGISIITSALKTLKDYLVTKDSYKDKPIASYVQVMVIVTYFIAGILIFTTLTGKSVLAFFTTLGAASAILLLIFKDTILGFVASIQVTINDMVRIGDWITMEKYGADGNVTEISLTTVKVQNFDKTITTIPTYNLISDSFKNWRGMQSSGGRRIKRPIRIKIASIKFLSPEDIERFKKIHFVKKYLEEIVPEISQYNQEKNIDRNLLINGRSLTNIGVFRIYIDEYLKNNPYLHPEMTMMVRQLEPKNDGLPIEIYSFTNDVQWLNYEKIMADIFDHTLAAVTYFDLEIFESPSSGDIKSLLNNVTSIKIEH